MKDFKSSANRLVEFFQSSRDKWKKRATDRHKENRALKVKIRDLENSRKKWKDKAKNSSDPQKKSVEENTKPSEGKKEPKNQSSKDLSVEKSIPIEGELIRAPKGHTYSTQVILWSLEISVNIYASLRGTHKILTIFNPLLGYQVPSYTSISNWGYRLGLHILQQPIEFREDWIIVLDETTQLDTNKALVILGIPLEQLKKRQDTVPHIMICNSLILRY